MGDLIPAPDLDIRDESQLAAQAIARTSGGLTVAQIDSQIEARRHLRELVAAGLEAPVCPELTNANPSSPHTVILEAQAWLLAQVARRINKLPKRDQIEFARLFGVQLRAAAPATTVLEFRVAPPPDVDVTVPTLTRVGTADGAIVFETEQELVIPFGDEAGEVVARRTIGGHTILRPGTLTRMMDPIAWVEEVSNPESVNAGADDESIEEALDRARNYQQRGERLVTVRDLEMAIHEDALLGRGITRAFPFVAAGDFDADASRPGHTTMVVMTALGDPISAEQRRAVNAVLEQVVGNQFVSVIDPIFVDFDVVASVRLRAGSTDAATLAGIETNLRAFYAATRQNFGRDVLRSEIITVIEGSPGVDRIVAQSSPGPILGSPQVDTRLQRWELPRLVHLTLTVV